MLFAKANFKAPVAYLVQFGLGAQALDSILQPCRMRRSRRRSRALLLAGELPLSGQLCRRAIRLLACCSGIAFCGLLGTLCCCQAVLLQSNTQEWVRLFCIV